MDDDTASRVHLDPDAINALLRQYVNSNGQIDAAFVAGRLVIRRDDLKMTIESVKLSEDGLEVRLRVGDDEQGGAR